MPPDPRVVRTRGRVLAAAWELLTEVGFDGVTVELISERSGVSRSTLYRHWQTKEEVLRDAFTASSQQPSGGSSQRTAEQDLEQYLVAFADGLALWGRAAASLSVSALTDPEQRAVQQTFTGGNRRDLQALLARAQQDGHARAGIDVDELVERALGPLFYAYLFTPTPYDAAGARRIAARVWEWLTTGRS